jgi:PLP dependent protein
VTIAIDPARRASLATALAGVEARISAACAAAGRDRSLVHLIVVTKTYPASDVAALADLGVIDVGESREAEAAAKAAALPDLRWHFIGRLQSNKAARVARYAHLVHSVDRPAVIGPLARGAAAAGRRVGCLLQVSLDGDPARGGAVATELPELARAVAEQPWLQLRGLMAVPPLAADPGRAYAALPPLLAALRAEHEGIDVLSAGMSGDLEAAVTHGATHLRVGSAILGQRSTLG